MFVFNQQNCYLVIETSRVKIHIELVYLVKLELL